MVEFPNKLLLFGCKTWRLSNICLVQLFHIYPFFGYLNVQLFLPLPTMQRKWQLYGRGRMGSTDMSLSGITCSYFSLVFKIRAKHKIVFICIDLYSLTMRRIIQNSDSNNIGCSALGSNEKISGLIHISLTELNQNYTVILHMFGLFRLLPQITHQCSC